MHVFSAHIFGSLLLSKAKLDNFSEFIVMTNPNLPFVPDHTQALFRSRLCSAFRSALACTIIGVLTIYTPTNFREQLKFPAFSYVVAVLIVSDATLGHTIRGTVLAVYATILGLLPAMLTLYMVRPEGISTITATTAVAGCSFIAVLSDISEGLIAKRIALGQIVLVYIAAFNFKVTGGVKANLHPVPVAASTLVGVVGAVVALVFPYPRLACFEVKQKSKTYTVTAMERLRLYVNALCADNRSVMLSFMSQAKSIGRTSNKFLHSMNLMQGTMQLELPPIKLMQPFMNTAGRKCKEIETLLKGLELALASTTSMPSKILKAQCHLKDQILELQTQIAFNTQEGDNGHEAHDAFNKCFLSLQCIPQNLHDLPPFFFIFCLKLLSNKNSIHEEANNSSTKQKNVQGVWSMNMNPERFLSALKCSLTLSLAIFLGLLYNKESGYWAGLTVAITFAPTSESTFKLASLRAHGTAIGSIYGIFGSLISQNLMEIRLLALVPWIVFTSFLQRSKMYGQAGAMSALLSALIIIGRRNYGSPILFTIDRLVETYIALCCSILFELLFHPTRASNLARSKLLECFRSINECVNSMASLDDFREKEKRLKQVLKELKKYIKEAEMEPNFWLLPFSGTTYNKLHASLLKMDEFVSFVIRALEVLTQELYAIDASMKVELDPFVEIFGASMKFYEEIFKVKSLQELATELKMVVADDIEMGRKAPSIIDDDEKCMRVLTAFLQNSKETVEKIDGMGSEDKTQIVLCFATIGFCVGNLAKGLKEIEKGVHELLQWENSGRYINLYDISCKMREPSGKQAC